jgi:positive regulator of sigma E activity
VRYYTITETAVVVAEEPAGGGRFLVEMLSHEVNQERCATCRMCSDRAGRKVVTAVLGKDIQKSLVVPGAKVLVEIKMPVIYAHVLSVFVLPIVGLIVGAGIGYALVGGEGAMSLLSVGLGVVGAVSLYLAGRALLREKITRREDPTIVAVTGSVGER